MSDFDRLLQKEMTVLERFVKFRIGNAHDADDVLQETCMAAFRSYDGLKDESLFKSWLLGISRHKCNDYFREKAKSLEIPIDELRESVLSYGVRGVTTVSTVRETLDLLGDKDKQILYLYYFKELPQDEIAKRLSLPVGTVKSRLHNAKQRFKEKYPYKPKGEKLMLTKMPKTLPEYTITPSDQLPFSVKWEEIMGWFIVPKIGEKLEWAMYDFPERKRTEYMVEEAVARAEVHGIEGVEILAREYEPMENNRIDGQNFNERRLVAQITDNHCRILAESHESGGVKRYYTFLDGDAFLDNWGFGEDNCGNETHISPKGDITRNGNIITTKDKPFLLDVVGRYAVTINGKKHDTICVMDVANYCGEGVVTEQYLNTEGRTILWRRFNANDWRFTRYQKLWTDMFPDNETLTVNGETYVHWYDCITDYIL